MSECRRAAARKRPTLAAANGTLRAVRAGGEARDLPDRPLRDAAECCLDARDWEALTWFGRDAETIAAVLRLTLPSTRAALDAARRRLQEREALTPTP